METRSRKRVEATTHRPSTATPARASKRARHSAAGAGAGASSASGAGPNPPPRTRPSTRTSTAAGAVASTGQIVEKGMDTGAEAVPSGSRRDREKSLSRRESDKSLAETLHVGEEQRGIADKEREMEKGKEKETDRVKDRSERAERAERAERDKAANTTASSGDDENDGEGGSNVHQNLASASSALHGLLRKLGAGLDELLPSSGPSSQQTSRLKRILSGLRAEGEEERQLEALSQLCELLSIGTEESLSNFSVDSFVPVLVGLLNYEYSPDIMLLAARALTHLCDVLPSSCAAVVHYGAVPCFCARLLTIEYIDLAEQSLQALEKISHEHPTACLRAGALMAVLSYLDFFSTGVQRVAVSTAANMCRQLPSDAADFVTEAVPLLTNLLQYQDSKVVEHASVCLSRIAETFGSSSEKLDMLCSHGLIPQVARLISVSNSSTGLVPQASLSTSTYTGLIRLLSTCASGSAGAAESLLTLRISSILKDVLAGSGLISSTSVTASSVNRPPEQLYEIVTLVNELLPPLPDGQAVPSVASAAAAASSSSSVGGGSRGGRKHSGVTIPSRAEESGVGVDVETSAREILLRNQPELLEQFGNDLFPVLVQVYGSSVNPPVRHKCLAVIIKLIHFSAPEMLRSLLLESNISSFLAGVLASKDMSLLTMALQIAEMLMQKLPDVFAKMFVKEGVVHALDTLITSEQVGALSPPGGSRSADLAANAVVTASGGILPPPRPRRGGASRRKSMGSTDEEIGLSTSAPLPTSMASPPSGGEPLRTIRSGLRASAIARAKKIRETHFPGDAGAADEGVTESLRKLKKLCAQLIGEVSGGEGKGKTRDGGGGSELSEEQLGAVVGVLLGELGAGDGVSTFEFVGSGVVGSLINYFTCGNTAKENVEDPGLREQALKRMKQFIEVALPREAGVNGSDAPLTLLVRKLQNALASLERFPVVLSHAPRSNSGTASIAAGLSALTQPFKLRLCRATGDKTLRDYSNNIVLIEPLATLIAVEDFLWPRVKRHERAVTAATGAASTSEASAPIPVPNAERRPSTRSRSAAAAAAAVAAGMGSGRSSESWGGASGAKGKGKAVSRSLGASPGGDESRGPETRNAAARRRAAAVSASTGKAASEGESEEDVEVSPVELEEAVPMDEDDLSEEEDEDEEDDHDDVFGDDPVASCKGDQVHDVQLGDAEGGAMASSSEASQPSGGASVLSRTGALTSGAESSGTRTGGSRGALSYAAAALASAGVNGSRGGGRERKSVGAAVAAAVNSPPKLVFSLGGKQLSRMLTIFQAIQRQAVAEEDEEERYGGSEHGGGSGRRLWDEVYTITYQRVDSNGEAAPCASGKSAGSSPRGKGFGSAMEGSWQQASLLDSTLQGELPCDLDRSNNSYSILLLLRVLEGLNKLAPRLRAQGAWEAFAAGEVDRVDDFLGAGPLVPREEFLSSKLTPKLARQMQDALALCSGGLPSWCGQLTRACPFLFPFETRRQYFHSTAFGLSRALQRLQQQQSADGAAASNDRELRVGRLQRQKVRVSRQRILESAAKVMELYAGHKAVLEVEYFGEVGTGLGPTLEFYTLLSHELQKEKLNLWRSETRVKSETMAGAESAEVEALDADVEMVEEEVAEVEALSMVEGDRGSAEGGPSWGEYVTAPQGLFPRPWHPDTDPGSNKKYGKVLEHFRLLGRVMAKALQDGRLLDVPLSTAFYKIILGQELDLYDIQTLDPELGRTLFEMQGLVRRKQFLETHDGKREEVEALTFRESRLEDLCLDFTLPGYPEFELKSNGRELAVDLVNLEEYVSLVVEATVKVGIGAQIEAFRSGFNQVFQLSTLQIFSEDELDYLLCGRRELWAPESLPDIMKFDHGYTASSPPIRNLLDIMSELSPEEQRAFLRFVTGAPRLPPGGLAALNPKLTIVRKHPTGGSGVALSSTPPGAAAGMGTTLADRDLPSVMTCANYLKLPPYSCKEIMRERLLYAIHEGQGSFDLS